MKRIVAVACGVLVLSGCTGPALTAPSPVPSGSSASGPGDYRPPSAFEVSCDELAPLEDLRAVWGPDLEPEPYREAGAQGSWEMQGTALIQDGALTCRWALPDLGTRITVLALADAVDGYTRSEPAYLDSPEYVAVEMNDGTQTTCRTEIAAPRCHWNVLAGDAWISLFFEGLPSSELGDGGGAATTGTPVADIASELIHSIVTSGRIPTDRVSDGLAPCSVSLDQAAVATALGVPVTDLSGSSGRTLEISLGASTPDFGQTMWAYSYERLGYRECVFQAGSQSGSVMTAPGAAWILDDPTALQGDPGEVDDLGRGVSACRTEGEFSLCTVAVAVGRDLALVSVAPQPAPSGLAIAEEIAAIVVP